jgi:hypothetical protein
MTGRRILPLTGERLEKTVVQKVVKKDVQKA